MQSSSTSDINWPLRLSGVLFALYLGNVLLGKLFILMGWGNFGMGDVPEFLTLFLTAVAFVIAILIKENNSNSS